MSRYSTRRRDSKSGSWTLLFDLREKETYWTDENKARLIKIIAKDRLHVSIEELQGRFFSLLNLIPDLEARVLKMHPDQLADLLQDPGAVAAALLQLRQLLPGANVSAMVAQAPWLLEQSTLKSLPMSITRLQELLDVEEVDSIVEQEPLFLDADGVEEALQELDRLMPNGTNTKSLLIKDPSYLLQVQYGQKRIGVNPDSFPDSSYISIHVPKESG